MRKEVGFLTIILLIIISTVVVVKISSQKLSLQISALKFPAQIDWEYDEKIGEEFTKCSECNGSIPQDWWYLLKITKGKKISYYKFNQPEKIFDENNNDFLETSPELANSLTGKLRSINEANPFGQLIGWEEAQRIFPRMAKATVRDLETGLKFNIQRRAGSSHADVQPLKANDSKILKQIYGGRWSWQRRSVVIEKGPYKIAASMNGMPHGSGAISGNDFPGHFCVHFYKSLTHSGNLDLAHQLMAWKAAGRIKEYLINCTPQEMVEVSLTAIAQNDIQLVILSFALEYEVEPLLNFMKKIASLKINSIKEIAKNNYLVELEWYELKTGKSFKEVVELTVVTRDSRYLVNPQGLVVLIENLNAEINQ